MICFDCPACQAPMTASLEAIGKAGACHKCSHLSVVPAKSTRFDLSVPAPPAPPAPPAARRGKPGEAAAVLWAVVLILAVLFCVPGLWVGLSLANQLLRSGQDLEAALTQGMRGLLCAATLVLVLHATYVAARALDRLTQ